MRMLRIRQRGRLQGGRGHGLDEVPGVQVHAGGAAHVFLPGAPAGVVKDKALQSLGGVLAPQHGRARIGWRQGFPDLRRDEGAEGAIEAGRGRSEDRRRDRPCRERDFIPTVEMERVRNQLPPQSRQVLPRVSIELPLEGEEGEALLGSKPSDSSRTSGPAISSTRRYQTAQVMIG